MEARSRLVARIGDINDPDSPRPLLTLEEFFDGNSDLSSIGDNRPRDFAPQEFFAACLLLRKHQDVADVVVEVKKLRGPDQWPCTDTIWIISSLARDELPGELPREFCERFLPEDWLSYPRADGRVTETMTIANGMRAQGLAYY